MREPIVRFFVIGVAIFGVDRWIAARAAPEDPRAIVIGPRARIVRGGRAQRIRVPEIAYVSRRRSASKIATLEPGGTTRERVIDVAGTEVPGEPDAACAPPPGGSDTLCAVVDDPGFDPSRAAFWYARVLEVPTCRWSHRACDAAGVDCATIDPGDPLAICCGPAARHVIRERAWTSPIWFFP